MAYTVKDFFDEWDISEQASPFYEENAFEVMVRDEAANRTIFGVVWAESEDYLRDDLVHIMTDSQYIVRIDQINPYTY